MIKQALIYLSALVLFACQKVDAPIDNNKGGVKISLKLNKNFAPSATKALVEDTYDIKPEQLSIAVKIGDSVVYGWDKMTEMPEIVFLEPGDYKLEVKTNGNRGAVNAVPYYYGLSDFAVAGGETSSVYASASIDCSSSSVTLAGVVEPLTGYTMKYFDIRNPDAILFTVSQAMNSVDGAPMRVYMDDTFEFGVKIEGRLNGLKWAKNVIVTDNIAERTYHNIIVK